MGQGRKVPLLRYRSGKVPVKDKKVRVGGLDRWKLAGRLQQSGAASWGGRTYLKGR